MALIKCVECDRKISTLADVCPHCGAPVKHSIPVEEEEPERDRSALILKLFLLLVALGMGYIFAKPYIDKYVGEIKLKDGATSNTSSGRVVEQVRGTGEQEPEDAGKGTRVTKAIKPGGEEKEPEAEDSRDVMRGALGIDTEKPEETLPKRPVKAPIIEIEPPPAKPKEPVTDKAPDGGKEAVDTVKPDTQVKKPDSTPDKTPDPKTVEPPAAKAGNAKLKRILDQAKQEKITIIHHLWIDEDGKLIVVVNKDWDIHSCSQREEIAAKISVWWRNAKGNQCEFQTKEGEVVATENRSARYIKGKVKFRVKGCEK